MFTQKIHRYIFLFGIMAAPLGIMLGRAPGSLPIIILMANWLLEGNYKSKLHLLKSNSIFWSLVSLYLLYLLGLFLTTNFSEAGNELRIGLPLIILPIVFFSSDPVSKKELKLVLLSFILGCTLNTLWCIIYGFFIHQLEVGRDLSRFMSHIRLGMFIDLVITCCIYLLWNSNSKREKILYLSLIAYFIATLFILGLASGLIIFSILLFLAILYFIYQQNTFIKITGLVLVILIYSFFFQFILSVGNQQLLITNNSYNQIKTNNAKGRGLICFDSLGMTENGNYVFRNIQMEDLRKTWNKRVPNDTFSYAPEHNLKRYSVLLRYLSSAELNKDEDGVSALTESDLQNIRKNITNKEYPNWSFLHKRIYELVNEYDDFKNKRDINGHSIALRMVFWKASTILIKDHFWFGIGTGNVQTELKGIYKKHFPLISEEYYLKPHNQFITIQLTYGIFGSIIFLWVLFYPIYYLHKHLNFLYWIFIGILLLSFLSEDTLGTQAGMAFYTIFNSLFCANAYFKKQQTLVD